MPNIDQLTELLTLRLYDWASAPSSTAEISGAEIVALLGDKTGPGIATQVFARLLNTGLLQQTVASDDEAGGYYAITPDLISAAETLRQSELTDDRTPRFTKFRDELVIALYHKSNEEGLEFYGLKALADENQLAYREGWIRELENFLDDYGYALVRKVMGSDEVCAAQLNASGLEYAEELITQSEEADPGDAQRPIPASDRYVEIDHNSSEYKVAVDAVDAVIDAVSGDNEYGDSLPEEKEAVVAALENGRRLLDSVKVRVSVIQATLLPSLQYIADNFSKRVIAVLGAAAVAAVGKLLGII